MYNCISTYTKKVIQIHFDEMLFYFYAKSIFQVQNTLDSKPVKDAVQVRRSNRAHQHNNFTTAALASNERDSI